MNRIELEKKLDESNISPEDYSLDGRLLPMRTVLMHTMEAWITFEYDEHGYVKERKEFKTEEDACNDMYNRLIYLFEWRKKNNVI